MHVTINNIEETVVKSFYLDDNEVEGVKILIKLPKLEVNKKKAKLIESSIVSREAGKLEVYLLIECEATMKTYVRKDVVELHKDPRLHIEFTLPSQKKSARK